MHPEHVHVRASDEPGNLKVPRWVFQLTGTVVSIVVATVLYMNWMDSRFASKDDLQGVKSQVQEVKAQIQDVSTDVKEMRRTLDNQFSK